MPNLLLMRVGLPLLVGNVQIMKRLFGGNSASVAVRNEVLASLEEAGALLLSPTKRDASPNGG